MKKLSPRQVEILELANACRDANDIALRVAINFHTNRTEQIGETSQKVWDELRAQFSLPTNASLRTHSVDGNVVVQVINEKGEWE